MEPTYKVHANGTKEWYLNGKYHREDGPAVEKANGDKEWWQNGKFHREDGPAVEYANGYKAWWLNGDYITGNQLVFLLKLHEYQLTSSNKQKN